MVRRTRIAVLGLTLAVVASPLVSFGGPALTRTSPPDPVRSVAPPPDSLAAALPFGMLAALGLGLVGIACAAGFAAWRFLPRTSLARPIALGCVPVLLLAVGYLLADGALSPVGPGPTRTPAALANPLVADAASIERGRALFATNCTTCHGPIGRGDGPLAPTLNPRPANLGDPHMAGHRDADLYRFISNGIPGSAMAAWEEQLSDRERWDLVNYVRTFAPVVGGPVGTPGGVAPSVGQRPAARLSGDPIPPALTGQLLYAADGRLWSLDVGGGNPADLIPARSPDTLAAEPALAPDGVTLAFTLVALPALGAAGATPAAPGADIYALDLRDGVQRLLLAHDQPESLVESLHWAPDGRALVYAYSRPILSAAGQLTGTHREVQRLDLATGRRTTLVIDARSPALSPDGTLLAYVASDPQTFETSVWLANADGSDRRQLVGTAGGFSDFLAPRFSPDGALIVFSAAGGPGVEPPPSSSPTADVPGRFFTWLVAPLVPQGASAHGLPGDLWLVGRDGRRLQRLTALYEDQPIGAWSPDGQWIAVVGGGGVYIVSTDGALAVRRSRSGGVGALVWRDRASAGPGPGPAASP